VKILRKQSYENSKEAHLKLKISKIDFESIMMDERLSDTEINIAQTQR